MKHGFFPIAVLVFILSAGGISDASAVGTKAPVLDPADIVIGFFYSGRTVHLRMETPPGRDIIVKVTGDEEKLELKKKGKVGGILWMNVGEVAFDGVPHLYFIRSSGRLNEMAADVFFEKERIGYEYMDFKSSAESDKEKRYLFGELVKLKEKEGLFSTVEGSVMRNALGNGNQEITADFTMPAKAPPGDYRVEVYGLNNGRGELLGAGMIHIRKSAAVSFISDLAAKHGLLYGCMSVAIAVAAGLITGVIFGLGKGRAH